MTLIWTIVIAIVVIGAICYFIAGRKKGTGLPMKPPEGPTSPTPPTPPAPPEIPTM